MERNEPDDPNASLLVLYLAKEGLRQTYCIYAGGHEEADSEFKIMKDEDPELIEVGRIWVNERTEYTRHVI